MIKQNIFIGFLVGISANIAGTLLYISLFSEYNIDETLQDALRNDYLGKIIALGAVFNFLPFFVFLKKKQTYHARGVLMATMLAAVVMAVFKIL